MELRMYTRYDVRNACSRIAKGLTPRIPELKEILFEKMAETNYNWAQFGTKWDVVVTNGEIILIAAIKDVDEVKEVCAKRQMIEELGVEKTWTDREIAVIDAIEAQFLDGIMDWSNYKTNWSVKKDNDRDTVVTYLLKANPGQKKITQADIDAKLRESMGLSPDEDPSTPTDTFEVKFSDPRPATPEDVEMVKRKEP